MAKGIYVGVDNTAKKVSKVYAGIDNVAKKVTKGYVGVGNVARPFMSSEEILSYYGLATNVYTYCAYAFSASIGNYYIVAGGGARDTDIARSNAVAYNTSLVTTTLTAISNARQLGGSATVGDYALFSSGVKLNLTNSSNMVANIDVYNTSLVRTVLNTLGTYFYKGYGVAGVSINNYAIFSGGHDSSSYTRAMAAYNATLTKTSFNLPAAKFYQSGATVNGYGLLAGGYTASESSVCHCVDSMLTVSSLTALSSARAKPAATTVGNYAIIGGEGSYYDVYNADLTHSTIVSPGNTKNVMATTLRNYALFPLGNNLQVATYNTSLTFNYTTNMSQIRNNFQAGSIGNYALVVGGTLRNPTYTSKSDPVNTVEVYTVTGG